MTSQSRKHRGYRTQRNVAALMAERGWPHALSVGAGASGDDITGVPGLSIEVKARTGFYPLAWLKQAALNRTGVPIVVIRCNGQGEDASKYAAMLQFDELLSLLEAAGYKET